jgi:hypothetical protein
MKVKRSLSNQTPHPFDTPVPWLPVDSRLFPFIGFGKVKGIARIFLTIEITLASMCVLVSVTLFFCRLFGIPINP